MFFAAILAGGIGTRLDAGIPKQFYEIYEKPLLAYCIEPFLKVEKLDKIIVSSPKDYLDQTNKLVNKYFSGDERIAVIEGGATRNGTILNSIQYALENGCRFLRMDTNVKNVHARKIYAKLGYREAGVVPCIFNGIEGVQLVLLEKTLSDRS